MERKIDETFELDGKKYITLEAKEESQCDLCIFSEWCESGNIIGKTGDCFDRKDGKYVYFEEVR